MAQLGLKLEQELAQLDTSKGLDAKLAVKWGTEETKRESTQWRPVRSMQLTEEQADVATARIVDIEDVEDFLVDLGTHSSLHNCHKQTASMSLPAWISTTLTTAAQHFSAICCQPDTHMQPQLLCLCFLRHGSTFTSGVQAVRMSGRSWCYACWAC